MTPKEFYEALRGVTAPAVIALAPGPLRLKVAAHDGLAAELLLWLVERLPADATQGDLDVVLDAAKWWTTFWASLPDGALDMEQQHG